MQFYTVYVILSSPHTPGWLLYWKTIKTWGHKTDSTTSGFARGKLATW